MKRKQLLALVIVIVMMLGIMPGAKALSFGGKCPSPYNHGSHFSPTSVPICFWCGYNGCTHTNNKWDDKKDSSVLPVYQIENEQNHRVISSYKRYCKDCGEYMKNVTDDGKLEAHNFTNGDTCVCGYKKPVCTHAGRNWEDVYDPSKDSFSDITSEDHTKYKYSDRYCKDCGAYVTTVNKVSVTQKHNFSNGNTCICGYKKPVCTHENGNWDDVYDSSVLPVYKFENEQNHRVFNSYKRYCKDCNQYVKNVTDDGTLRTHSFTNGDTCICGYKKPVSGGEGQHVGVSAKIDTEYRQYGNATAHQKRDVYGYTCSICSETVIERYTEWTEESHRDSGDGWCLYCGAAVGASKDWESLIEGDPEIVASTSSTSMLMDLLTSVCSHSLSIKPDYIELNATFHLVQNYIVCSICGMEELIEDVSTGIHDLDSIGKCTACGWKDKDAMVEKYYTILKNLPSGSNPMKNPVISEIVWTKLIDSGMSRDEAKTISDMIENVPEKYATYRDIYIYSMFLYDTDRNWIPTEENSPSHFTAYKEDPNGSFQDDDGTRYGVDNKLYININKSSSELPTVWFHESGHATEANYTFDQSVEKWATDRYIALTDCFETMKDDVETFIVAQATSKDHPFLTKKWKALTQQEQDLIIHSIIGSDEGYPVRYDAVNDTYVLQTITLNEKLMELRNEIVGNIKAAAYSGTNLTTFNAYMSSDCVEGMTNGRVSKVFDTANMDLWDIIYTDGKAYGGHISSRRDYWYTEDGQPKLFQCMEAWAEYYAAVMTNNTDAINSNLYFFPSTCEYFNNELAPKVLAQYKKIVREY